jgi:hypothetical protein
MHLHRICIVPVETHKVSDRDKKPCRIYLFMMGKADPFKGTVDEAGVPSLQKKNMQILNRSAGQPDQKAGLFRSLFFVFPLFILLKLLH